MKKLVLLLFIAAGIAGVAFAQTEAPLTTINGTLGVSAGRIAVTSGTTTYYVRGLERFVGFIDGLKEGAQVALEGYASAPFLEGQTERLFFPAKMTLNGKSYDLAPNGWGGGHCGGYGMGYGGGGHGGRGYRGGMDGYGERGFNGGRGRMGGYR